MFIIHSCVILKKYLPYLSYFNYKKFLFTDYEKINCTFEDGFCYWRQDLDDDSDWERVQGPTFPLMSGPEFDHTFGNLSGKMKNSGLKIKGKT